MGGEKKWHDFLIDAVTTACTMGDLPEMTFNQACSFQAAVTRTYTGQACKSVVTGYFWASGFQWILTSRDCGMDLPLWAFAGRHIVVVWC